LSFTVLLLFNASGKLDLADNRRAESQADGDDGRDRGPANDSAEGGTWRTGSGGSQEATEGGG